MRKYELEMVLLVSALVLFASMVATVYEVYPFR